MNTMIGNNLGRCYKCGHMVDGFEGYYEGRYSQDDTPVHDIGKCKQGAAPGTGPGYFAETADELNPDEGSK